MKFSDPHLLHAIAYAILSLLVIRIGYRMFMTASFRRLRLRDPVLAHSKERLIDLLGLEAIRVSPVEAGIIVMAHLMLVWASTALYLLPH